MTSQVINGLLRPHDGPRLKKYLPPPGGEVARLAAVQLPLASWADLVKSTSPGVSVPQELLQAIYHTRDPLYGVGTAKVMALGLERGRPEDGSHFIDDYAARLYQGEKLEGMDLAPDARIALNRAIEREAEQPRPFATAVKVFERAEGSAEPKLAEVDKQLRAAIEAYCKKPLPRDADLLALQRTLESDKVTSRPALRDFFSACYDKLLQRMVNPYRQRREWDRVLDLYSKLIALNPRNPTHYFARGKLRWDYLGQLDEALEDLSDAIQRGDKEPGYRVLRADLYLQAGKPAEAIKDYEQGLSLLRDVPGGMKRAELHRKIACASLLPQDVPVGEAAAEQVQVHTKRALEESNSAEERARAQENLGLLYLRQRLWDRAIENGKKVEQWQFNRPWNWAIRYIALCENAFESDRAATGQAQQAAYNAWEQLKSPKSLVELSHYIPGLLKKHFGVTLAKADVLRGTRPLTERIIGVEYLSRVEKGERYQIDLESAAFDSYLIVRTPGGKIFEDDDGGVGFNSRLVLVAEESGQWQITATSLSRREQGPFTLLVRALREGQAE
jgi:tetratricopeptide (TPR) repeat protein